MTHGQEDPVTKNSEVLPTRLCDRMVALDDVHVRSDGSGRVVEAYAAVFNRSTEVMDQDGHYNESLTPTAFDRTIQHKGINFVVLFNHGMTINGTPNPEATMPIGVPVEVRADERGLFTATRYLDNPIADHVLDAIKKGAIRAQSFSGRFTKSVRSYPEGRSRSALPLITRQEVDMREYGPAVFAAYPDAAILGMRAEQFVRALLETPPDKRVEWLEQFEGLGTPLDADPLGSNIGTPLEGPAEADAEDPPTIGHSARLIPLATRVRVARITRGLE
jgi:HK97 family phage prohead protease